MVKNLLPALLISLASPAFAVDRAPRISDREIIEALAELKAGQKILQEQLTAYQQKTDARFDAVDQRFDAVDQRFAAVDQRFAAVDKHFETLEREMDKRFAAVDKRFDALEREMDKRFDAVDKRFDAMSKRIDDLHDTLIAFFGAMMAILMTLFGYIVWDRRTALRPLQDRIERLESEVVQDLQLHHRDGSRFERLMEALRTLAKDDERLARVLHQFSLI